MNRPSVRLLMPAGRARLWSVALTSKWARFRRDAPLYTQLLPLNRNTPMVNKGDGPNVLP